MAGVWLAALLAMGGVWFVRNLIAFGNPIPAAEIHLGPLSLPLAAAHEAHLHASRTTSASQGVWGDHFLPGLLEAYGPPGGR